MKRDTLVRTVLPILYERQKAKCFYCGIETLMSVGLRADWKATLEHIIPKSKGGSDEIDNLVMACFRCNQLRGDGSTRPHKARRHDKTAKRQLVSS